MTAATIAGYTFTADQQALLTQSMELVGVRERQPVFVQLGRSPDGFQAARVGLQELPGNPLFALHARPSHKGVVFAVFRIGAPPELQSMLVDSYSIFAEAVKRLGDELAALLQEAKASLNTSQQTAGLGSDERRWLGQFAAALGDASGGEGFAEFRDVMPGVQSCAVGVKHKGATIIFATFVGVRSAEGFECSVRNFQNEQIPGLPARFSSVALAIDAHNEYFKFMVTTLRKWARPWWKKLF